MVIFRSIITGLSSFCQQEYERSALPWAGRCMYTKGYAFLAISHRAANATGSLMAISDSILRLIWMPATF